MPIDSVGILPWLNIAEPVEVGPITFYPARNVAHLLGERAGVLVDRLRIYRDTLNDIPVHGAVAIHRDQIVNGGHSPYQDLRRATDIFLMAAVYTNDGEL